MKQHFYKSFGVQHRLQLHFYSLSKERIACALKTWRSWINAEQAIEREISLATKQLWAIQNSIKCSSLATRHAQALLLLFESKKPSHLTALFNAVVLKRIWLRILIVTNKYSWPNWDQRKSPDNRGSTVVSCDRRLEIWSFHVVVSKGTSIKYVEIKTPRTKRAARNSSFCFSH